MQTWSQPVGRGCFRGAWSQRIASSGPTVSSGASTSGPHPRVTAPHAKRDRTCPRGYARDRARTMPPLAMTHHGLVCARLSHLPKTRRHPIRSIGPRQSTTRIKRAKNERGQIDLLAMHPGNMRSARRDLRALASKAARTGIFAMFAGSFLSAAGADSDRRICGNSRHALTSH